MRLLEIQVLTHVDIYWAVGIKDVSRSPSIWYDEDDRLVP